jgi:CheY-like chemotaxis protein
MAGTGWKASNGATAVVADDEVHVVDLIALLLESLGVKVVKVYDGEEALQAIVEHRARLLITDLLMPKLRGDELTRRIKAHPETADVKVVIVTSQPRESIADIPADAFISKPFDLNHVEAVVLEYLAEA